MIDFINSVREYFNEEFTSNQDSLNETNLMDIKDKIKKGYVLTNLDVEFIEDVDYYGNPCFIKAILSLNQVDYSKFNIGDPVRIINNNIEFEGLVIVDVSDGEIIIEKSFNPYSWSEVAHLKKSDVWQLHPYFIDMRSTFEKCTSYLRYNLDVAQSIFQVLYDKQILPVIPIPAPQHVPRRQLNSSQLSAFKSAMGCENYYLIQGPPGSGKTTVIAEIALALASEGKSVLLTGPTNTSINNALKRIGEINNSNIPVIKLWSRKNKQQATQLEKLNVSNRTSFNELGIDGGYIVGSTCFHPYTRRIQKTSNWDVVIFDEASQIPIPLALLPMSKSNKWIFVGDHKQLPPVHKSKLSFFKKSVFETLHDKCKGTMLSETFRMNESINRFPNEQFYNGKLLSNVHSKLDIDNNFNSYQKILDVNRPEVVVTHNKAFYPSRSLFEADLIKTLISEYHKKGVSLNEISVITPFKTQVKQIQNSLKEVFSKNEIDNLFIDTIEKMQGKENEIVIISYAVSDPEIDNLRLSYLFNLNRLNVALTRSKKKRIFIGSKKVFDTDYSNPNVNELTAVFKAFLNDSFVVDLSEAKEVDFDIFLSK